jgi:hypothetical protein
MMNNELDILQVMRRLACLYSALPGMQRVGGVGLQQVRKNARHHPQAQLADFKLFP